jgi:hypothetical protein
MIGLFEGKLMGFQVDTNNISGIVNRGSQRLKLNDLARELFWLGMEHRISLNVEWIPREESTLADELSKLIIPDDSMPSREIL